MASAQSRWQISGDYFENCNCDFVCPCLFSPNQPFTSRPTEGACEVAFGFHIDQGSYGDATLDGLNAAVIARAPGPMADGNWSVALYLDERADEQQRGALQAIFTGQAGGPVAVLSPFFSTVLGVKSTPITFTKNGNHRAVEIPAIMHLGVHAVPSLFPDKEIWSSNVHPFAETVSLATGDAGSTWQDYGMRWDNSGKNGHYAPIRWTS